MAIKVISHVRFALLDPERLSEVEKENQQKNFVPVSCMMKHSPSVFPYKILLGDDPNMTPYCANMCVCGPIRVVPIAVRVSHRFHCTPPPPFACTGIPHIWCMEIPCLEESGCERSPDSPPSRNSASRVPQSCRTGLSIMSHMPIVLLSITCCPITEQLNFIHVLTCQQAHSAFLIIQTYTCSIMLLQPQ